MTPVNSDSDSDDSQPSEASSPFLGASLETVQRSYASQLAQEIKDLEADRSRLVSEKGQLQSQIDTLREEYAQLTALTEVLRQPVDTQPETTEPNATEPNATEPETTEPETTELETPESNSLESPTNLQETVSLLSGPLLPGEVELPVQTLIPIGQERTLELPTPSTSEQRRQIIQKQTSRPSLSTAKVNRGLVLSAIATTLAALHYCLFGILAQGGTWINLIDIGQLGSGFVPATALLWLRMLIMVPGLLLLAPQLYRNTWQDLQSWLHVQEQLLLPLISSGVALFFSQILLYKSIGLLGAAIGSALFFLYPLTVIPSGLAFRQERLPTPFGLLALVAIAMGALLIAQPIFTAGWSNLLWIGLLSSVALSLYMVLTNFCYQQRCHPIPTSIAQFSTVAVLSSLILLVKPLQLSGISWAGLLFWGLAIGALMLVAYLLNYASLLAIGPRSAIVAAFTPLLTSLFSFSFTPVPTLAIVQWTGILMITVGGIALGKEKLDKALFHG